MATGPEKQGRGVGRRPKERSAPAVLSGPLRLETTELEAFPLQQRKLEETAFHNNEFKGVKQTVRTCGLEKRGRQLRRGRSGLRGQGPGAQDPRGGSSGPDPGPLRDRQQGGTWTNG